MSFVRTVLGDIPSSILGRCYAHEHIIIDHSYPTEKSSDFLLNDVEKCTEELKAFHRAGGRAMIDSMPCDCGRNVLKLVSVSEESGIHIVAPTGLHLAKYYPSGHWSHHLSTEAMQSLFEADITDGIDRNDYGCPVVERTSHRAGVIKIATGDLPFTSREDRIFEAAAGAHRSTGCPILTHTEKGLGGIEQIRKLEGFGVDLTKVVLSHTDRKPDSAYHRDLLRTGVRLEYDSAFRWKPSQGNPTLNLVLELSPEFPDQIMLGMDAARSSYWRSYGGAPGLTFLLTDFTQSLQAKGISEETLNKIFVRNPAAAYSFTSETTGATDQGPAECP